MHFSKVATPKSISNAELLFQVQKDNKPLDSLEPCLSLLKGVDIEIHGFAFSRQDNAIHVLLGVILKVVLLHAAVLYIQDTTLAIVFLTLQISIGNENLGKYNFWVRLLP